MIIKMITDLGKKVEEHSEGLNNELKNKNKKIIRTEKYKQKQKKSLQELIAN